MILLEFHRWLNRLQSCLRKKGKEEGKKRGREGGTESHKASIADDSNFLRLCCHMVAVSPSGQQAHKAKSIPKFKKKVRKDHICNKI